MDSILKKLYHGQLEIQENMRPSPALKEARAQYVRRQEEILSSMDEATRKACMELLEEANAMLSAETEEAYMAGMKLGAKMTAELLSYSA